ncbi:MAG: hypothetical protein VX777_01735 [Chlamydiota bacterium]|nr:hypothetical protein [Chlamydiota bacterium]
MLYQAQDSTLDNQAQDGPFQNKETLLQVRSALEEVITALFQVRGSIEETISIRSIRFQELVLLQVLVEVPYLLQWVTILGGRRVVLSLRVQFYQAEPILELECQE